DVPQDLVAPALQITRALEGEIGAALADDGRGERLREGLVVAIAGPPNAGKSTLLNRIAKREAAIVSPYAGTTRDVIEVHLDLGGLPVTLLDTAGIYENDEPVEVEGGGRARGQGASAADLVLWVVDARDNPNGLSAAPSCLAGKASPGSPVWVLRNKIDLLQADRLRSENKCQSNGSNEPNSQFTKPLINKVNRQLSYTNEFKFYANELKFNVSAASGEGVDEVLAQLMKRAQNFLAGAESALVTRERHRHALKDVLAALRRALALETARDEDLLAEELRVAARALGRLTGRVDVEDILDVIFRDFCIGK